LRSLCVRAIVPAMNYLPIPQWAKKHKISRRKAEYLASSRPDFVVMVPKKITRIVHVKAIEASTKPDNFMLAQKERTE